MTKKELAEENAKLRAGLEKIDRLETLYLQYLRDNPEADSCGCDDGGFLQSMAMVARASLGVTERHKLYGLDKFDGSKE